MVPAIASPGMREQPAPSGPSHNQPKPKLSTELSLGFKTMSTVLGFQVRRFFSWPHVQQPPLRLGSLLEMGRLNLRQLRPRHAAGSGRQPPLGLREPPATATHDTGIYPGLAPDFHRGTFAPRDRNRAPLCLARRVAALGSHRPAAGEAGGCLAAPAH